MKRTKRNPLTIIGLIAAVCMMMGASAFAVVSSDQVSVYYNDTRNTDNLGGSDGGGPDELYVQNGTNAWASYLRFPIVGGAIDGVSAANMTSAELGIWVTKNGDYDHLKLYVLNDSESYFEANAIEVVSVDTNQIPPVTNSVFYDYVGLSETNWTSGSGTNQNMNSTNLCHGPFFSDQTPGWDTHLTLVSDGRTTPGTEGGTDDRDNILGDQVGLFPIPITDMDAFKAAVSNDTNGEITMLLVSDTLDSRRMEVTTSFDAAHTNRSAPVLSAFTGADTTAPTAVTNLVVASAVGGVVDLSWSDVIYDADMAGFKVYRSTTSGSYGAPVDTITNIWATSYQDTGLASDGTTYYYKVNSFDEVPNEAQGNEVSATPGVDSTPPSVPSNLVVAAVGDSSVTLDWDASTDAQTSVAYYNVYRSTTSGSYGAAITNVTAPPYADSGLVNDTTYYYKVSAVDSSANANESALSAETNATPVAFSGISVTFGSNNDGYAGFTTSPLTGTEVWSLPADSVHYAFEGVETAYSSLMKSFILDRSVGATHTIKGVLDFTDGYGDDNNRLGILLFSTNSTCTGDTQGGLLLRLNVDNSKDISIRGGGYNGTDLATTSTGVSAGDTWVGQELTFTADLVFTNVLGTNLIDVTFTLTDQALNEYTTSAQVAPSNYPGTYFGFAQKIRNRGSSSSNRNVPPDLDYKSFSIESSGGPVPDTPYQTYLKSVGLTGDELATDDADLDGLANLYEYGIGGNANDSGDNGTAPILINVGGAYYYVYPQLADSGAGLAYTVEANTNLLNSASWTAIGTAASVDVTGGDYNTASNLVTTVEDERFIRLKIDQN